MVCVAVPQSLVTVITIVFCPGINLNNALTFPVVGLKPLLTTCPFKVIVTPCVAFTFETLADTAKSSRLTVEFKLTGELIFNTGVLQLRKLIEIVSETVPQGLVAVITIVLAPGFKFRVPDTLPVALEKL